MKKISVRATKDWNGRADVLVDGVVIGTVRKVEYRTHVMSGGMYNHSVGTVGVRHWEAVPANNTRIEFRRSTRARAIEDMIRFVETGRTGYGA